MSRADEEEIGQIKQHEQAASPPMIAKTVITMAASCGRVQDPV